MPYAPFESNVYPQREDVNGGPADHHVVRHPGPARPQAVDDVRAGPADAASARPVLAEGGEQALRGAEEARGPRVRTVVVGDGRQAATHRVLDHPQGPTSPRRV